MIGNINEQITEVIFVGLPGPTHHYGGLSSDNVASTTNRGTISNPHQAALQVVGLVRLLQSLGVTVGILPPQLRPNIPFLKEHFSGSVDDIIRRAAKENPGLLEKASSASAMWVANAATVTSAIDAMDNRLHITPANLFTHVHRRIEADATYSVLSSIFREVPACTVHPPLPNNLHDEGAANHMRLAPKHNAKGLNVFVYGEGGARQDLQAWENIVRYHRVAEAQVLYLRQNPDVIWKGVFHNDVIAVSNENVLLMHEKAYVEDKIRQAYAAVHPGQEPVIITIKTEELSIEEAVGSYFFNSQIITRPDGSMAIIAPKEVQTVYGGKGAQLMERIIADTANPIASVHYIDLKQSMKNGGGPACLRLRVPLTAPQLAALKHKTHIIPDEAVLGLIEKLIDKYYPSDLSPKNLGNPMIYYQGRSLLDELGKLMLVSFI